MLRAKSASAKDQREIKRFQAFLPPTVGLWPCTSDIKNTTSCRNFFKLLADSKLEIRKSPQNQKNSLCIFQLPQANYTSSEKTDHCNYGQLLSFAGRHQKRVVKSPSLNSPERSEGDGRCWANLQNTHFSGLTRKNPVFERSVLMYVSIKNRILTPSGQKRRVCVNQPDRLYPASKFLL